MTNDITYKESNTATTVVYERFRKEDYARLLSDRDRAKDGQRLLDYLCDKYSIPRVRLQVISRPQPNRRQGGRLKMKTFGDYNRASQTIRIFNLTAVKQQVVSIKVFAETLLHEFMHHYDINYLKLSDTPHTKGFYMRISDLQRKLSENPS